MRISNKYRQLLSLSVLTEILHHPYFRFKVRRKNKVALKSWSAFGLTIYKVYFWQKGKILSSYYALFSGDGERIGYDKAAVAYALDYFSLEDELFTILWEYGDFLSFLEDMYNNVID